MRMPYFGKCLNGFVSIQWFAMMFAIKFSLSVFSFFQPFKRTPIQEDRTWSNLTKLAGQRRCKYGRQVGRHPLKRRWWFSVLLDQSCARNLKLWLMVLWHYFTNETYLDLTWRLKCDSYKCFIFTQTKNELNELLLDIRGDLPMMLKRHTLTRTRSRFLKFSWTMNSLKYIHAQSIVQRQNESFNLSIKPTRGVSRKTSSLHADIHSPEKGMFFILISKKLLSAAVQKQVRDVYCANGREGKWIERRWKNQALKI